jgi:hypothetical protein
MIGRPAIMIETPDCIASRPAQWAGAGAGLRWCVRQLAGGRPNWRLKARLKAGSES